MIIAIVVYRSPSSGSFVGLQSAMQTVLAATLYKEHHHHRRLQHRHVFGKHQQPISPFHDKQGAVPAIDRPYH